MKSTHVKWARIREVLQSKERMAQEKRNRKVGTDVGKRRFMKRSASKRDEKERKVFLCASEDESFEDVKRKSKFSSQIKTRRQFPETCF